MTRPRRRRSNASVVANPVLVGAVTTLVIVVAVFLAYNANNGLPFVPTRQLDVLVSNGANLVKGNEVRSGGFRVGVVTDMQPVMLPNHKVGARLTLKLDKKLGGVPVDSKVVIRPRSALGLKYVELDTGRSKQVFADGATMPAAQASVPVDIDEVYNMFDAPTRRASQGNLQGFGDALAGRGADLNQTIQVAPQLFGHLGSVMANLSAPRTELPSFFKELGDAARIVAPVSKTNAHLFTTMANTFDAISRDPQALKSTISKSPPTLRAGTESLLVQRPFLEHTAALSRDLDTATTELRAALPTVNSALRVGTPVQRRSVTLNDNLQGALGALEDLVKAPTTLGSLRGLTATVGTLQPQLRYLGPYVTVCNSWNIFWTFAAEHLSAPDDTGSSQRALLNMATQAPGTDGIGSSGANEFAHGKGALPGRADQYVHNNVYAPAIDEKGNADCGAGQTGYIQAYNPLRDKSVKGDPYQGAVDRALPDQRAPRADLRAVRQGRQGPRPEPRPRPRRGDVHRPARRPRRRHREAAAMRRRRRKGLPPFAAGVLALALMAVVTYFGFTKEIPFKHHYTVQAVFPSANGVRNGSPVRVAGVNVGKVTAISHVEDGKQAALVTMRIDKKGLPLHRDATMKIRPRIFLEGNFFVDVSPGSPSAPQLHDGDRLPINQTSAPVQLDQVLSALQAPTRKDLQALLRELSSGLKGKGAARLQRVDPLLEARLPRQRDRRRRRRRARSPATSARYIDKAGATAEAIDRNREQLKSLVTDFDTTAGAFAAREQELSAAVGELPRTLNAAMPALGALNRSFPAVRGLIRAARPAVRSSGPAIDASMPFVRQARGLVSKPELRGLSHDLRPLVPALTTLNQRVGAALLPALAGLELPERRDPALDQGQDRRQDVPRRAAPCTRRRPSRCPASPARAARATPTASGSASCSPRRSSPTRWAPTSSSSPASRCRASTRRRRRTTPARRCAPTCRARPSSRRTCARCPTPRRRASTSRNRRPPRRRRRCRRPSTGCARTSRPRAPHLKVSDVPATVKELDEVKTAIRKHAGHFAAVIGLALLAALVGGYIVHNQRMRFPWEGKPFELQAAFSTAQAVTPGQGQTVRVSGVRVGDITKVGLKDGHAVVTLSLDPEYKDLVHTDATALLRPKTGLKDMFIELDPGTGKAPLAQRGWTLPVSNTLPDVNPDEILASLDSDTRDYLTLLVDGAGRGLKGRGNDLREVFRRFEPTHRDLARVNRLVAQRHQNLSRLVHSLGDLNDELAGKSDDLAALVDSSSAVFRSFASEQANVTQRGAATCPARCARRPTRWAACSASPRRCDPPPCTCSPPWRRSTAPTAPCSPSPRRPRRSSRARSGPSCATRGRWCARPRSRPASWPPRRRT